MPDGQLVLTADAPPSSSGRPALLLYAGPNTAGAARSRSALSLLARGVFVLCLLPAALAPFVSFAWGTCPVDAIVEALAKLRVRGVLAFSDEVGFVLLGAPLFLAPVLAAGWLRWLIRPRLTRVERRIGWGLAILSGAMTVGVSLPVYCQDPPTIQQVRDQWEMYATFAFGPALLGLTIARLALRARSGGRSDAVLVAIGGAYLANAVMCLIGFCDSPDVGWWLTLIAASAIAIDYVLSAAIGVGRWLNSRRSASSAPRR